MRKYINDCWYFKNDFQPEYLVNVPVQEFEKIRIPHTVREIPLNYVNNQDYQMVSTYYTELDLSDCQDQQCDLVFDGNAHYSTVYLNGKLAATHANGYTRFSVPLNDAMEDGRVKVVVKLDSRESLNIPPFGNVIDYLTYGGIYRDTYLEIRNESHICDVFAKAAMDKSLTLELSYHHVKDTQKLHIQLGDFQQVLDLQEHYRFENLPVKLWDVDSPNLYDLRLELLEGNRVLDTWHEEIGFRSISGDAGGIYLNGKKIKIRGLNRHQSYAYVGYAMPERVQRRDARILKYQLGLNAVRTSHYPDSHDFISECDRIGLLVFTEIPGWQHIGDQQWQDTAVKNTEEMVLQYRNHPSIFMWGVRINESVDNHDFYVRTNEIARKLDDTRLIGGVRCFKNSELLEDVYTYNDFFHNGTNLGVEEKKKVTRNKDKAYLVTEYNGHMFPTKMFDDEIHRNEHIKRHYQVLNDVCRYPEHAGSFGWCMADYNTHKDFGSGDQICYHGVLDMFRNPKPAAYVYASQSDREPILEISSTMDIGEHPGGYIKDIMVMTNCDKVRLYKGAEFVREFYPSKRYACLKHAPIFIDDLIGETLEKHEKYTPKTAARIKKCLLSIQKYGLESMPLGAKLQMLSLMAFHGLTIADGTRLYETYIGAWGDENQSYRIEGIRDGQVVKEIRLESFASLQFNIASDTLSLVEGKSYDVASVTIEALNQAGNHLCYFQEPLTIETEGAVSLIGPKEISLKGGFGGFYIKSQGCGTGKAKVYYHGELVKELSYTVTKA